jgi:hypothetical protein
VDGGVWLLLENWSRALGVTERLKTGRFLWASIGSMRGITLAIITGAITIGIACLFAYYDEPHPWILYVYGIAIVMILAFVGIIQDFYSKD